MLFYTDPSRDKLSRAFVQYTIFGQPHEILQKPHGNSKSFKLFVRAMLSVGVTTGVNDSFGATATSSKTSPTVVAIP